MNKCPLKGELSQHRDRVHFPEEKICPFCDKPFKSRFIISMKTVKKLLKCFVSRFFRDRHVKKDHRVSPPRSMDLSSSFQFKCDQCDFTTKKELSLRMHKRKHKSKEDLQDMEVDEMDE